MIVESSPLPGKATESVRQGNEAREGGGRVVQIASAVREVRERGPASLVWYLERESQTLTTRLGNLRLVVTCVGPSASSVCPCRWQHERVRL
jgi:hypothetical protein